MTERQSHWPSCLHPPFRAQARKGAHQGPPLKKEVITLAEACGL